MLPTPSLPPPPPLPWPQAAPLLAEHLPPLQTHYVTRPAVHWPDLNKLLPAPLEMQRAPSLGFPAHLPAPLPAALHSPWGARVSRRVWGKCLRVYQSSSDCLTAGAGLPASLRLEFQPFSLLNTLLPPPPPTPHNKLHSFPASQQQGQPGTSCVGTEASLSLPDSLPFLPAHSAVILAGQVEGRQGRAAQSPAPPRCPGLIGGSLALGFHRDPGSEEE